LVGMLGVVETDHKDDLTELTGLDSAIETKLNEIGIYTFAQIARIDAASDLGLLTVYISAAASQADLLAWKIEAEEKLKNDNN